MALFGEAKFKSSALPGISSRLTTSPSCEYFRNGVKDKNKENIDLTSLKSLANDIFGFNGWSHSITNQTIDFIDYAAGRYEVGISVLVKVTLKDGTFHEDLGYGICKGFRCKGSSIGRARKLAAADALRNALSAFGKGLGVVASPAKSSNIPLYCPQPLKKTQVTLSKVKRRLNYDGPTSQDNETRRRVFRQPCGENDAMSLTSPACNSNELFSPVCAQPVILQGKHNNLLNLVLCTPGNVPGCVPSSSPDCEIPAISQSTPCSIRRNRHTSAACTSFQRDSGIDTTGISQSGILSKEANDVGCIDYTEGQKDMLKDNIEECEPLKESSEEL